MAKPYSADLRERVLRAGEAGVSPTVIAERFGVGLSTVYLWRQQARADGRRCAKPHGGGRARGIDPAGEAILRGLVAERNDREFVVGPSQSTRGILDLVQKVAKLSATVLILGESGTGKELLARLIHRESGKPSAPFVAVNLAAIPKELVESALFGHEKGAFTGAIRQQLGKFELAAGGTLFLDEIGDMRYEVQAKLLRAIQEAEIERVGGTHPIKTDIRLIAATNVDLDKALKEGRFREDLFYRLNVIPIRMPALREKPEDIPALAEHFLEKCREKFKREVAGWDLSAVGATDDQVNDANNELYSGGAVLVG